MLVYIVSKNILAQPLSYVNVLKKYVYSNFSPKKNFLVTVSGKISHHGFIAAVENILNAAGGNYSHQQ
jgi:hypothetical protein